jgi:uncharacterized membrane protein YphA (DoxX/SURF4 family)
METRLTMVIRILLGLAMFVFGLNKFLHFMPTPEHHGAAAEFLGALAASGYIFPITGLVETVCGFLLLTGLFVPLALVLLAPVMVNIVAFHAFLDPAGIAVAALLAVLHVYLGVANLDRFNILLRSR